MLAAEADEEAELPDELVTAHCKKRMSLVLLAFLLVFNVATSSLYTIANKVCQDVYGNANAAFYNLAASIVQFSIGTVVLLCTQFSSKGSTQKETVVCLENVVAPDYGAAESNRIPDRRKIKTAARILLIAVCCAVPNTVWAITGVQVKVSLQSLMGLLSIPCTYLLTVMVLKRTLPLGCKVGAFLVVLGTFIGSLASLHDEDIPAPGASPYTASLCCMVFALMYLPYSYQYIVTESLFLEGHSLWAVEVCSGWLEVAILCMIAPAQGWLLESLGEEPQPFNITQGVDCLRGRACLDDGHGGQTATWWPAFLLFGLASSSVLNDMTYLIVTKYCSAACMTVASGFSTSVVGFISLAHFMGRYQETFSYCTIIAFAVSTAGMVAWSKGEQQIKE